MRTPYEIDAFPNAIGSLLTSNSKILLTSIDVELRMRTTLKFMYVTYTLPNAVRRLLMSFFL